MGKQEWKPGNMLYPLPAVMVSCQRPGEKPNILTVAWTGTVCTNPPMAYISVRPERYSYGIIRETGEFVINLTTEALAAATDYCGVRSGRDTDKFQDTHLTPVPASKVQAPMIAESPVNLECRVVKVEELGSHHMFLASIEAVHVDDALLDENGKFHLNRAGLLAYSHGEYAGLGKKIGTFGYSVKKPGKRKKQKRT
ncbi:MAG: flavin reductase family protein [Eubacteriales bacterium]|nr:flavin reductase family protein [Eubacteriales bacterium]